MFLSIEIFEDGLIQNLATLLRLNFVLIRFFLDILNLKKSQDSIYKKVIIFINLLIF